ncbi:NOT2 family protein [Aspergillus lentulus]|uniref:NOT2 family protein n=1 Tax=Aspergillus lentulus TaxID=293939 RepID=A0ABQ1B4U4_ASPLE|nr:NOT2 family protein [Aspergillus lentulus]GFF55703.1 NOT2 family protein [Aspergillus lentulus]GFF77384.1 NOT2 family protein [Aspergillus lentulus]GFF93792.1 NOT2 family protein [Aspergillus lentulus]GFF94675.1 NOT2 family protein [Aspergillus lentulus]GFG18002.1 NOT2 family protein [Aspergillus lentulus]
MDGRAIWLALWACLLEIAPSLSIHCFVTFALINHCFSSGPGPQPLRGMSGFPAQQQAQARNATLASARLPNGKLGSGANWNFNLPVSGTPGLQGNQQRNVGAMGTFAQSLSGGSQPATPLDLSDFPSLSGAPQQSQTPNPGLVWGQRALQQTPQRQQHPTSQAPSRAPQTQSHHPQQQSQPSHEDVFPSGAQFANRLDDFRNGGQGISGQLGGSGQPQTGNIDEFPPLGRNVAAELGQDRRESLMQSTGLGNFGGTMPFTGANQNQSANRTMIGGSINGQDTSRMMSPTNAGSTAIGTSRSPVNQGANGVPGSEKEDLNVTTMANQRNFTEQQQAQQPQAAAGEAQDVAAAAQSTEQPPLAQMSELDRFGLAGLLRMIHSDSPDVASLAVGQDLMTLGLDLNQPEPLHTSFASPFVASMSAVPMEQNFSLPACYSVANIQPLQTRIPSFSDETLFYIFYSMPRDIVQELAAEELMGRKWRYHKIERCWLTRDETYPGPVDVEPRVSERGVYLIWDPTTWKKIRREFILRYEDLDNRLDHNRGLARPLGFPHQAS